MFRPSSDGAIERWAGIGVVLGPEAAQAARQIVANTRIERAGWIPTVAGLVAMTVGATAVFAQLKRSLNAIWDVTHQPPRHGRMLGLIRNRLLSLRIGLAALQRGTALTSRDHDHTVGHGRPVRRHLPYPARRRPASLERCAAGWVSDRSAFHAGPPIDGELSHAHGARIGVRCRIDPCHPHTSAAVRSLAGVTPPRIAGQHPARQSERPPEAIGRP